MITTELRTGFCSLVFVSLLALPNVAWAQPPSLYSDLHDFGGTVSTVDLTTEPDGYLPNTEVIFDQAGDMYGTTYRGGTYDTGTVWEITAAGHYETLHDFGGQVANANGESGPDGSNPLGAIAFDRVGNLYGTAGGGGGYTYGGMVWEIKANGSYVDLHDFGGTVISADGKSGLDGSFPAGGVTLDSSGDIFGAAEGSGANRYFGMVWEVAANGTYTDLHDFGGAVLYPDGTTGADGADPSSRLALDSSGNLFGTAGGGGVLFGTVGSGMLWEITTDGLYRDLHNFGGSAVNADGTTGMDGAFPDGGLTLDATGNMFGTTTSGGPNIDPVSGKHYCGMVWELTASGSYKDLHDFGGAVTNADGANGPDGLQPASGVTIDAFGNLYGTAQGGPIVNSNVGSGSGMIWEIPIAGGYEDLHDFGGDIQNADLLTGPDGVDPVQDVALDAAGNLYGVTLWGGPYGDTTIYNAWGNGMVWKLSNASATPASITGLTPNSAPVGSQVSITIVGSNFAKNCAVAVNGTSYKVDRVSSTGLTFTMPSTEMNKAHLLSVQVLNPGTDGASNSVPFTVFNLPVISSLTPNNAPVVPALTEAAAQPATITVSSQPTITISGQYFDADCVVLVNGTSYHATRVNSGEITFVMPSSKMDKTHVLTVQVENPATGAISNGMSFTVTP